MPILLENFNFIFYVFHRPYIYINTKKQKYYIIYIYINIFIYTLHLLYVLYQLLFLQHSDALESIFHSLGLEKAFSLQLRPEVFQPLHL